MGRIEHNSSKTDSSITRPFSFCCWGAPLTGRKVSLPPNRRRTEQQEVQHFVWPLVNNHGRISLNGMDTQIEIRHTQYKKWCKNCINQYRPITSEMHTILDLTAHSLPKTPLPVEPKLLLLLCVLSDLCACVHAFCSAGHCSSQSSFPSGWLAPPRVPVGGASAGQGTDLPGGHPRTTYLDPDMWVEEICYYLVV